MRLFIEKQKKSAKKFIIGVISCGFVMYRRARARARACRSFSRTVTMPNGGSDDGGGDSDGTGSGDSDSSPAQFSSHYFITQPFRTKSNRYALAVVFPRQMSLGFLSDRRRAI